MTHIKLNSEQAALVAGSSGPVLVQLPDGTVAGILRRDLTPKEPLFTQEEIAEAQRRAQRPGPRFTTEEVLAYLESLDK